MSRPVPPPPAPGVAAAALRALREYGGFAGDATYLWPRWLVLRGVGLVYLIIFAGIIDEGRALVGPHGLTPVADFCANLRELFPHALERFIRAPSLFWLSTAPGFLAFLPWAGLAAAAALVLNLWPRVALGACWAVHLSFVATWQVFSPTIIDGLLIETAFLSLFFAPPGLRPGLGAAHPPRALALFMMRWLLFRIMFGSGFIKVFAGDPRWRDFTAMEQMYQTSPAPTLLGYLDFHLPHAYHLLEIALTFTAELVAPFVAIFGGRRGRWFAFAVWAVFQEGIQLTGNFGWLNTSAIALGLLLLDDAMLADLARRLRLLRLAQAFTVAPAAPAPAGPRWPGPALAAVLWTHFGVTIYYFVLAVGHWPAPVIPEARSRPVDYLLRDFRSANAYVPFATFPDAKFEVEYLGSNDGGATWRSFPFRVKPQREDRMSPILAPRWDRFEASLQLGLAQNSPVIPRVAEELLRRNPDVMRLFASDPFPDRPPDVVRMMVFKYTYTSLAERRRTGHYWRKEFAGDVRPALVLDETGHIVDAP